MPWPKHNGPSAFFHSWLQQQERIVAVGISRFAARLWKRTPLGLRACAAGLLVSVAGILPWPTLMTANLKFAASVPWAVPVMAGYLAGLFAYLNGWGWPRATADDRRLCLRARGLSVRVWFWSLTAGAFGGAALFNLFFIGLRLGQVPPAAFDEYIQMARYPAWTVILWLMMSALVAGSVEEAAFRGYMQGPLERRYGPAIAIAVVALVFFLAHFAPIAALPGFVLGGIMWGLLAFWSGSILPGVILHTLVDTVSFLWAWSNPEQGKQLASSRVWETGVDTNFCLLASAALVLGLLSVAAFAMLATIARDQREKDVMAKRVMAKRVSGTD